MNVEKLIFNDLKPSWLCYDNSTESMALINPLQPPQKQDKIRLFLSTTKALLKDIKNLFKRIPELEQKNIVFVAHTQNQYVAVSPLLKHYETSAYVISNDPRYATVEALPDAQRSMIMLFYFFPVWFVSLFAKGFLKKAYLNSFSAYLSAYAYYYYYRGILKKAKPRLVVLSNDHSYQARVMLFAAKKLKIKTLYIPHASIAFDFPPLEFDYAFLEGNDMLNKYDIIADRMKFNSTTACFLIGVLKFDSLLAQAKREAKGVIGVCASMLEEYDKVVSLCKRLSTHFPEYKFIFRAHPRDPRDYYSALYHLPNFSFSKADQELSSDFILKIDTVISGTSNIFLEALILKRYPVFYDYSERKVDVYQSFVNEGIVSRIYEREEDVIALLEKNDELDINVLYNNARKFCATLGTSYEGKSARLANLLVQQMIEEGDAFQHDPATWTRYTCKSGLQAYVLKNSLTPNKLQ